MASDMDIVVRYIHVPTYVERTDSSPNYQLLIVAYIVCCCLRPTDIRLQTLYIHTSYSSHGKS